VFVTGIEHALLAVTHIRIERLEALHMDIGMNRVRPLLAVTLGLVALTFQGVLSPYKKGRLDKSKQDRHLSKLALAA
jgi:hypothetical protein